MSKKRGLFYAVTIILFILAVAYVVLAYKLGSFDPVYWITGVPSKITGITPSTDGIVF